MFEAAPTGGSIREELEREITPESIEALSDAAEPGAFYRGLGAGDALRAVFGKLELDANPKSEVVGSRDNASLNLVDAIPAAPTSETRDGEKFLCAIGFEVSPTAKVEESFLGRYTNRRITGPVVAREIVLRFAGKEPGQPPAAVTYLSPQNFYQWYLERVAAA